MDPGKLLFYHLWAYKHLWDARQAAGNFLYAHGHLFPAAQAALVEAAAHYRREAELVGTAYDDPSTYIGSFEDLGACIGDSGYEDHFEHEPPRGTGPAIYRNVGEGWSPSTIQADDLDDRAIENDRVSITPLQFDLTAYDFLPRLRQWLK